MRSQIEAFPARWNRHRNFVLPLDGARQCLLLRRLAVDQKYALERRRGGIKPRQQFALIGVAAELVKLYHLGAEPHHVAEDGHLRTLFDNLAPECMLRLETGNKNRVPRIFD